MNPTIPSPPQKQPAPSSDLPVVEPAVEMSQSIESIELRERRIWENFKRKHLGRYYVPRHPLSLIASPGDKEATGIRVFQTGELDSSTNRPVDDSQLPVRQVEQQDVLTGSPSQRRSSWLLWLVLLALAIAGLLYAYSQRGFLLNSGAGLSTPASPLPELSDGAQQRLYVLANAIATPANPAEVQPGAELDRISLALHTIDQQPKPDEGNLPQARELQAQALEYVRQGDFERAYPLFTSAHKLAPGEDMIEVMLAMTEMRIGHEADAQRHLIEALNTNPRNASGWRALGDLTIKIGNGSAANIKQASDYYLVAWWFASDRKKLLQTLDLAAESSPSVRQAVQQLHARIEQ